MELVRTKRFFVFAPRSGAVPAAATPAAAAAPTTKPSYKLDQRRELEARIQAKWREDRTFHTDPRYDPTTGAPLEKFLVTFPYPYMNGRLHLGHAFSLTKAEFTAGYQRLKGRVALFPFGFHCTGMPIQAAANKLRAELAEFGTPPQFPPEEVAAAEAAAAAERQAQSSDVAVEKKGKGKKSKLVQKTGSGVVRQWNVLSKMVDPGEIPEFVEPLKWLSYFPPHGRSDLDAFGVGVDWRRSFITTSVNPYYDAFVRWQFNTLRATDRVRFGKRANVYSVRDAQVCADHDRASGETVGPQEYTLIKLRVREKRGRLAAVDGEVYLAPATLRPETMYGQTNCFVLPDGEYGAYRVRGGDVLVMSHRAAVGLAHQGVTHPDTGEFVPHTAEWGAVDLVVGGLTGWDLLGLPLEAPRATYETVYTLPLLTISMDKGTGVVTSVPSDAPDDYVALMELKDKPEFRAKYNITADMVEPFDVVPIINIPGYGDRSAELMVQKHKIRSCRDADKLKAAKEEVYLKGFYEGVMIVGEHEGTRVEVAKPLIRAAMIAEGTALSYFEPESKVVSRSGDECIVAMTDQWYITYGEEAWRERTLGHVRGPGFDAHGGKTLENFVGTLGWLREWACSRMFGLGTQLPWDDQWVIESLSDSTIYMAYYTIAHLLQGEGNIMGERTGPLGVEASQLTDACFDYVFLGRPFSAEACGGVPEEKLAVLKREFEYWYPMDLRVSAKDLIPNHLTMCLYNHTAIWEDRPEMWPRGMYANGHIMVNGEKMSKQKGNFLMMLQCCEMYSADATRFGLADAGDTLDDANFEQDVANSAVLALHKEDVWIRSVMAGEIPLRDAPESEYTYMDRMFANEMDFLVHETDRHYALVHFRDALKTGWFEMQLARDLYRDWCERTRVPMHSGLVRRFVEVQTLLIAPVCPHFAEGIWGEVLGREGSVRWASWPAAGEPDKAARRSLNFLREVVKASRISMGKVRTAAGATPALRVYVSSAYEEWKVAVLRKLAQLQAECDGTLPADLMARLKKDFGADDALRPVLKAAMQFAAFMRDEANDRGPEALEEDLPYDQRDVVETNMDYLCAVLGVRSIEVVDAADAAAASAATGPDRKKLESCTPGKPAVVVVE